MRLLLPGPPRWLRQRLLRIDRGAVDPKERGFACDREAARARFLAIGGALLDGHAAALRAGGANGLETELARTPAELRGFAYEGAALALALLDSVGVPRRERWSALARGAGARHVYMLHVGAGLARARLDLDLNLPLAGFDPLLGALVADGAGFHAGYFHWTRDAGGPRAPERVRGYARRAFDQGLGRSLWFVSGAEPARAAAALRSLERERHADLWSGLGLACAYAGGAAEGAPAELVRLAGAHAGDLAQGACFAAEARARAGNEAPHVDAACRALCGIGAAEAAEIARSAREGLPAQDDGSAYEAWRTRIRARCAARGAA